MLRLGSACNLLTAGHNAITIRWLFDKFCLFKAASKLKTVGEDNCKVQWVSHKEGKIIFQKLGLSEIALTRKKLTFNNLGVFDQYT